MALPGAPRAWSRREPNLLLRDRGGGESSCPALTAAPKLRPCRGGLAPREPECQGSHTPVPGSKVGPRGSGSNFYSSVPACVTRRRSQCLRVKGAETCRGLEQSLCGSPQGKSGLPECSSGPSATTACWSGNRRQVSWPLEGRRTRAARRPGERVQVHTHTRTQSHVYMKGSSRELPRGGGDGSPWLEAPDGCGQVGDGGSPRHLGTRHLPEAGNGERWEASQGPPDAQARPPAWGVLTAQAWWATLPSHPGLREQSHGCNRHPRNPRTRLLRVRMWPGAPTGVPTDTSMTSLEAVTGRGPGASLLCSLACGEPGVQHPGFCLPS